MKMNLIRIRENVKRSETRDLLDRVTCYRDCMEPEAITLIMEELYDRGITDHDIELHQQNNQEILKRSDGSAVKCSFCYRPAVQQGRGWHKLFGIVPIFQRSWSWCEDHRPHEK